MDWSDLSAFETFVAIAELGSLRAAARFLGVNPPAVSSQLKAFETRIGTTLFLRSTRSVTLTDAGRTLYDRSKHLLEGLGEALAQARDAGRVRSGLLRISLPFRAWQLVIAPRLEAFQTSSPNIVLDLEMEEGLTDIVARGFHVGIRLGDHLQDDMIAVRLSREEDAAYIASPAYSNGIVRQLRPNTPAPYQYPASADKFGADRGLALHHPDRRDHGRHRRRPDPQRSARGRRCRKPWLRDRLVIAARCSGGT